MACASNLEKEHIAVKNNKMMVKEFVNHSYSNSKIPNLPNPVNFVLFGTMRYAIFDIKPH